MKATWLAAGPLALAIAACSNPQQIVLSIDTTEGVPCDIDKITIQAIGSDTATFERDLSGERLPLVVKLSDETATGTFNLQVTGYRNGEAVLGAAGPLQFGNSGDLAAHIVLDSNCTAAAPCKLPDLTPYTAPAAPISASAVCGENVLRYSNAPATEAFVDVCSVPGPNAGKVLNDGTHGAALLGLSDAALTGFGFQFYGKKISRVWAHEDGYISFTAANPDPGNDLSPGAFDRDLLGSGVPPPPQSIMAFWDRLTLSSNGICYALDGTPGTQKLRITWSKTCQTDVCTADSLNFTIVLDEHLNRISLTYGDMIAANVPNGQGASATVGIVNDTKGGCPVSDCTFATGMCKSTNKPCGYAQEFSKTPQTPKVRDILFAPVVEPKN